MREPLITNDPGLALLALRDCGEAVSLGELAARMWPGEVPDRVRREVSLTAFRRVRRMAHERAWWVVEDLAVQGLVTHHGRDSILITDAGERVVLAWGRS